MIACTSSGKPPDILALFPSVQILITLGWKRTQGETPSQLLVPSVCRCREPLNRSPPKDCVLELKWLITHPSMWPGNWNSMGLRAWSESLPFPLLATWLLVESGDLSVSCGLEKWNDKASLINLLWWWNKKVYVTLLAKCLCGRKIQ